MKATNLIKYRQEQIFFNDIFELQHAFRNSSYSYLSIINWQYEQKPIYYYIQHLYSSFQQSLLFKSIPYWFLIKNSFLCKEQKSHFRCRKIIIYYNFISCLLTQTFEVKWKKKSSKNYKFLPSRPSTMFRVHPVAPRAKVRQAELAAQQAGAFATVLPRTGVVCRCLKSCLPTTAFTIAPTASTDAATICEGPLSALANLWNSPLNFTGETILKDFFWVRV